MISEAIKWDHNSVVTENVKKISSKKTQWGYTKIKPLC